MTDPAACQRCGTAITPDPQRPGAWFDQSGSYACPDQAAWHVAAMPQGSVPTPPQGPQKFAPQGASQRPYPSPHPPQDAPHGPQPARKKSRTGAIIGWTAGGVAVLAILVVAGVLLVQSFLPALTSPEAGPAPQPGESSSSSTAPEGFAKPCTGSLDCFQNPQIGDQALKRISDEYGWRCYEEGEEKLDGFESYLTAECQGINDTDRNFEQKVSVGYNTATDETGTDLVSNFQISADVSAVEPEGQSVTEQDGADVSLAAFEAAAKAIWPDQREPRQTAIEEFTKIHQTCASASADQADGAVTDTGMGFRVQCYNMERVSVDVGGGAVTSYSMLMNITATA